MSPVHILTENDENAPRKIIREKRLMDSITQLADGNDDDRINAAKDIVKLLVAKQEEVSFGKYF